LKHIYKAKAVAVCLRDYYAIRFYNFEFENPSQLDFLSQISFSSEEERMQAHLLGIVTHEVGHCCQQLLTEAAIREYEKIIDEETMPGRKKYVSDYVLKHAE